MKRTVIVLFLVLIGATGGVIAVPTSRESEQVEKRAATLYVGNNLPTQFTVRVVESATGKPLANSTVKYQQISRHFIFSCEPWARGSAEKLRSELGAEWCYIEVWWTKIEKQENSLDFSDSDGQVRYVKKKYPGMKIMACIMGIVSFYEWGDPPDWSAYRRITVDPESLRTYKKQVYRFVHNLVSHHKGEVDAGVTPKEIHYLSLFQNYHNRPIEGSGASRLQHAVALSKIVTRAIEDADPNAVVLLGVGTPSRWGDSDTINYARECVSQNVSFDAIGFIIAPWNGWILHNYSTWMREISGLGKPIVPCLVYSPSFVEGPRPTYWPSIPFDQKNQAKWLAEAFEISWNASTVVGFGYSQFQDSQGEAFGWGLLAADAAAKEAYWMYKELLMKHNTTGTGTTNENGLLTVQVLPGEYRIHVTHQKFRQETKTIHVFGGTDNSYEIAVSSGISFQLEPAIFPAMAVIACISYTAIRRSFRHRRRAVGRSGE